ncbi:MAG: hypothetical protein ACOVQ4_21260 [Flectobacillus sp.]|uniref:hypothetical protein n=1 Tax=Flectobacillus sp. TaxID=50419 RepID=UPI003B99B97E
MKHLKIYSIMLVLGLLVGACKTEMVEPIDLNALETGGYIRTVSPYPVSASSFTFKTSALSTSKMEFLAEAITPNFGALFSSYDLVIKFVDATPANGTKTTSQVALKSIPASSFTKDPTSGYPRATISVSASEALTATKLTASDISVGDSFEITGTMKLTNGKTFTNTNTGPNITGGAFYSSPFFYKVNVIQ